MLRSVIRNLIHRPFVYSLDIFISINQERINSDQALLNLRPKDLLLSTWKGKDNHDNIINVYFLIKWTNKLTLSYSIKLITSMGDEILQGA